MSCVCEDEVAEGGQVRWMDGREGEGDECTTHDDCFSGCLLGRKGDEIRYGDGKRRFDGIDTIELGQVQESGFCFVSHGQGQGVTDGDSTASGVNALSSILLLLLLQQPTIPICVKQSPKSNQLKPN